MGLFSKRSGERPAASSKDPQAGERIIEETIEVPDGDKIVVGESIDVGDSRRPPVETVKAKLEAQREWMRAILAILFVALLALVVIWSFIRASNWNQTADLLDRLLPAITALLGSAIGFYFGTKRESD